MFLVSLKVGSNRLDGAIVHSLRSNEEPMPVKLFISHRRLAGPFLILKPRFRPLAEFVILIQRGSRCVHIERCLQDHLLAPYAL